MKSAPFVSPNLLERVAEPGSPFREAAKCLPESDATFYAHLNDYRHFVLFHSAYRRNLLGSKVNEEHQ